MALNSCAWGLLNLSPTQRYVLILTKHDSYLNEITYLDINKRWHIWMSTCTWSWMAKLLMNFVFIRKLINDHWWNFEYHAKWEYIFWKDSLRALMAYLDIMNFWFLIFIRQRSKAWHEIIYAYTYICVCVSCIFKHCYL